MTEIIFLVEPDEDGGYVAQALGESIITQAEDLETLKQEVKDAVHCHFPDETLRPKIIRLHIILSKTRYLLHKIAQRFIRSRLSKSSQKVRL
jgi:predicted RNase H-like HicB family nuclease